MATPLPFYIGEDDPPAKRAILRAALQLFSTQGLAETSIRDIAKRSGFTNPALYKHFASKQELALHLFETCHTRLWTRCASAVAAQRSQPKQLAAYIGQWLELMDEHPDVMAFLSDSARVLWPQANATVRRHTMIGLARSLMRHAANPDLGAASLQGTLAELARMIQVGVVAGPATRWKPALLTLFRRLAA
jgi:AcrR family transcriptional regulator